MLSAVIVNYRTPELLKRCLRSFEGIDGWDDVVVVDNASGDESSEMVRSEFASAHLIRASENRGFGAGANLGMATAKHDRVLLLNPDTWVGSETAPALESFFDSHAQAGVVGCGLFDPDGLALISARRFYTPATVALRRVAPVSAPIRHFELADLDLEKPTRVDWVAGSGMALRKSAFDSVGGFDQRFFLYFEDVDLCLRMWLEGYEVWQLREAPVFHDEQRASSRSLRPLIWHLGSWLKYESKWAGLGHPSFTDSPASENGQAAATPPPASGSPVSGRTAMHPRAGRASPGALTVGIESSMLLESLTGVGRSLEALIKAFAERDDIDPLLIGISLRRTGRVHRFRSLARTRAIRFPARGAQAWWDRFDSPPVEYLTGRLDVFHGPNFFVPPTRDAAAVVTVHDLGFARYPEYHTERQRELADRLPKSLDRADRVITVSEFTRDELADWGKIDVSKIDVVPHGVRRLPTEGPRPEGLPSEYILYAGTLEARKGAGLLLEGYRIAAAGNAATPPLVIAGGRGLGGDEAIAEAKARGLDESRLITLGRVDDATLGRLFADATVFVFPSLYEGFGLPPLEALADGVPVIAAATSSLPEVLGDAALLVEPEAESIGDAISKVLDDRELRAGLATAGPIRAGQFTWSRSAELTIESYKRAVAATAS